MFRDARTLIVSIILTVAVDANFTYAETHDFYKGKTIRIVVGFTAGGAFDVYSRTIARYMGQHIPGAPAIIVENMAGAGSLVAANHLYKAANPDGLSIGNIIGGLFVGQVLGRPGIEFDALKFEYLGSPMKENTVCVTTKRSGITNVENWRKAKVAVKLGATAPGATTHDSAAVLKAALDLPTQIVSGYKGAPEIRLAMQNGELDGTCTSWESIRVTSRNEIQSGDAVVVLQITPKAHPELPNVPLAIEFAKTERSRQLIQAGVHDVSIIVRPYVVPPGTPKARVQLLRKAFVDTLQDAGFLADAKKSNLDLEPISGEELEKTVAKLFKVSPAVREDLSKALLVK